MKAYFSMIPGVPTHQKIPLTLQRLSQLQMTLLLPKKLLNTINLQNVVVQNKKGITLMTLQCSKVYFLYFTLFSLVKSNIGDTWLLKALDSLILKNFHPDRDLRGDIVSK